VVFDGEWWLSSQGIGLDNHQTGLAGTARGGGLERCHVRILALLT
jgi:hypothetical protein